MFLEKTKVYAKIDGKLSRWDVNSLDHAMSISMAQEDAGRKKGDNQSPFLALIQDVPVQKELFQ